MLKEIVGFSKKLEEDDIYEKIQKSDQLLDNPILVIPVKERLSDFNLDNIYFVFKDIINKNDKYYGILDKDSKNEIKKGLKNFPELNSRSFINTINEEDNNEWKEILFSLTSYMQKLPGDIKGNKCIGGNKGIFSYNLLIFSRPYNKFFKSKELLQKKFKKTYKKKLVEKIVKDIDFDNRENFVTLFTETICSDNTVEKIYNIFDNFIKISGFSKSVDFKVIFKLPSELFENDINLYNEIYSNYLKRKSFNVDIEKLDKLETEKHCPNCGEIAEYLSVPYVMHNFSSHKPFKRHLGRKGEEGYNIRICSNCALYLSKFQMYFLDEANFSLFPLFIGKEYLDYTVSLFEKSKNIKRLSFQNIIQNIYNETSEDELDFYLIIYNRFSKFLSVDYITGFQFYKNGNSVFQIESILNKTFFDFYLKNNYFSDKIDTKNKYRNNLLHQYRSNIFDFIYRAKYNSLTIESISNIYYQTLIRKLKSYYDNKSDTQKIDNSIKYLNKAFYKIEKYFGGKTMETIKSIRESQEIDNLESLSYYIGQTVYFLLTKSEKKNKTHAMVEPFINVNNFKSLALKIDEMLNAYKHAIGFNWRNVNKQFARVWYSLYEFKDEKFSRELKMLFYAGYFNSEDNIFFEKSNEGE